MRLHGAQWGFMKARGTRGALLVARILCELVAEREQQLTLRQMAAAREGLNPGTLAVIHLERTRLEAIHIMLYFADIKKSHLNTARTFLRAWLRYAKSCAD